MKQPSLRRILKQCQKVLRLTDWEVSIRFATIEETDGDLAAVFPQREHRIAEILILDPALIDPKEYIRSVPIRELVLHELLHIYIENKDPEREEQAIWAIARALDSLM